ncbi:MAG: NifB/NifX family molybdenum-iron cluster-binding protein [Pirellulales bacterium]|nr:NifB/NifX family molybdenum-iron cluster-binding protein [Pirellulales bacterium]
MKIAIPLAGGRLAMHFGHCEHFALVDMDEATRKHRRTEILPSPPHEPGLLPRWLHEQGAEVIIAGGMGQRAQQLFTNLGIQVVYGVPSDTPETIAQAFLEGTIISGNNLCDH